MSKNKKKTLKAAAKRFSLTGKGKVKRNHAKHSHLLEHKAKGVKRKLRSTSTMNPSDAKRIKKVL